MSIEYYVVRLEFVHCKRKMILGCFPAWKDKKLASRSVILTKEKAQELWSRLMKLTREYGITFSLAKKEDSES